MKELVDNLVQKGILKSKRIIDAFYSIDRKDFIVPGYESKAYSDHPLPIEHGQTISQPYTVAFMFELLEPAENGHILDVGSGSGWTTALLAHIVGPKGCVRGVEIIPELVLFGKENLKKYDFAHADIQKAGKTLGLPKEAPFDKILVSAGTDDVPQELLDQLKVYGTMVIPIKDAIWKIHKKSKTDTDIQKFDGFVFVPLIN